MAAAKAAIARILLFMDVDLESEGTPLSRWEQPSACEESKPTVC